MAISTLLLAVAVLAQPAASYVAPSQGVAGRTAPPAVSVASPHAEAQE
eukprot:CAMPEP_0170634006 /NCGR_PEP_ID=MMETSP0224-20130122/36336_1 /TAXON_ID=285029 /ORGANISM="Togula jolla, Strain CCCM 725" /LENGTH=47 /DNA_ID= /DNA_START= /DNA_END= /DNA_ORIENTATION=